MNHRNPRVGRELAALAYLDALDAGNLEKLAALWEQASADPELESVLCELSEGLAAEQEPSPGWHADVRKVQELLRAHLPSAFPPEPVSGPLTAGDVAARIAGDHTLLSRLAPDERDANARLLADPTALPSELGVAPLERWSRGLGVQASAAYWRLFRHVAVLLAMGRGQPYGTTLAAAREAARPAPGADGAGQKPAPPGKGGPHT